MNQRDERKLATRRALSSAAIRLFSERGYDDTRAGDIAAEVGVSERTFFFHFPTKDRSVFPDHDERVEALRDTLTSTRHDIDPLEAIIDKVSLGILTTTDSAIRAQRYRLINQFDALRHRDVINDLDYEQVFAEFLTRRWSNDFEGLPLSTLEMPIDFHARVFASTALTTARAALTSWAQDPTFNPERSTVNTLRQLAPWITPTKGTR